MRTPPRWTLALLALVLAAAAVQLYVDSQRVTRIEALAYLDARIARLEAQLGPEPVPPTIGGEARSPEERWRAAAAAASALREVTLEPAADPELSAAVDALGLERVDSNLTARQIERLLGQRGVGEALALAAERQPASSSPPTEDVSAIDLLVLVRYLHLLAAGAGNRDGGLGGGPAAAVEAAGQLAADLLTRREPHLWRVGALAVPPVPARATGPGSAWTEETRLRAHGALRQLEQALPTPERVLLLRILDVFTLARQALAEDDDFDRDSWNHAVLALRKIDPWYDQVIEAARLTDAGVRRARLDELDRDVRALSGAARALAFSPGGELEALNEAASRIAASRAALAAH